MTFSDDDLKRLKEDCGRDFTGIYPHQKKAILALIARLEAAEHWALDCQHDVDTPECACEEAWLKAAGK